MTKVLIIHPSLGLGGAEKIIAFLANRLSKKYDTHLLLLKNELESIALETEVNCYYENVYNNNPILGWHLFDGIRDFERLINAIASKIDDISPEIVICFDLRVLLATYIVKKNRKFKMLFSERADPYENSKLWASILKRIYKKIDYVVFQTEAARDYYGDIVNGKCSVIANPAFKRNKQVTETYRHEKEYIFSAGRLQSRKGFDVAIEAFCALADKFPNIDYLIFGHGSEEEKLKNLIVNNNMQNRIFIKEPINNIVDINKSAKLFVMPSRSEGIPNILIEAMMEEIPCVATDCSPGGARMLSDNGKYFRLAQNDNPQSLSIEISAALSDIRKTNEMCLAARKSLHRFNPNLISDMWFAVLNMLQENIL